MNFRDWLHLLGMHHWGEWTEEVRGVTLFYIDGPAIIQKKVCKICKRKELRAIAQSNER